MRETVLMGHSLADYQRMFGLNDADLHANLLEYCCGVTAVNAELHAQQLSMVSCDPLFSLDKDSLSKRVHSGFEEAVQKLKADSSNYHFKHYGNLEALIEKRREGLTEFFADYDIGKQESRYLPMSDPHLPFADFTFDFALSAFYLFVTPEQQTVEFQLQTIQELARVAKEVRIFPLADVAGQPSSVLGPVLLGLHQRNFGVEIREVDEHLYKGSHAMLRVWARECPVV